MPVELSGHCRLEPVDDLTKLPTKDGPAIIISRRDVRNDVDLVGSKTHHRKGSLHSRLVMRSYLFTSLFRLLQDRSEPQETGSGIFRLGVQGPPVKSVAVVHVHRYYT